jgi:hypothetical protein
VPIAFCMLLLAGLSMDKSSGRGVDSVETGSIGRR